MADPEFEPLGKLDDDELYAELGRSLLGDGPSFGPEDFARYRAFAVKWLAEHTPDLRSTICGKFTPAHTTSQGGDVLLEAATVADILTTAYGRPTAAVLGVILTRRGLSALCQ